jgi:1-deoxy-D-xylulose-5-phosphate synthase
MAQPLLNTAYHYPGPALVRYPRDSTAQPDSVNVDDCVEIGKALQLRQGEKAALLVFGSLLDIASVVADELNLSLVNMRFIKPLDETLVMQMAADHDYLITLEDSSVVGGAGSAVLELLNRKQSRVPLLRLGLDDFFPSQGSREQILEDYGLDPATLKTSIIEFTSG